MELNSDKIEEATEVTQTQEQDLHSALEEATETKPPIDNATGAGWDFTKVTTDEKETIDDKKPDTEERKGEEKSKPGERVPDTRKKLSAETATLMWDQFLQLVGNARVNSVFKKKLTPEEKERILTEDLEDKKLDEVEESDKVLKRKFDRLLKKRDAKIKNIPLNPTEWENHVKAFYNYFKVKDIELPPEWALAFTLGGTLVDRVIEVEAD